jgi:two-component system, cell cycle sensor histidine kinase and response regulator CckA
MFNVPMDGVDPSWDETADQGQTEVVGLATVYGLADQLGEAHLVVLAGHTPGASYPVETPFIIGRGSGAHLRLHRPDVSRKHAKIDRDGVRYRIQDLGTVNGTFVNGKQITETTLRFGDKVRIGASSVVLFTRFGQLEEALIESQKLEAIGRIAGGIAHDFNNLLQAIRSSAAFLKRLDSKRGFSDPEAQEALDDMEAAVGRASELTSKLLGFARRGKYSEGTVSLEKLSTEVHAILQRTVGDRIRIKREVDPHAMVRGDEGQLHQALLNLCVNACDAMPEGGLLQIRARLTGAGDRLPVQLTGVGYVIVEVEDTGHGMDEATVKRVFEPYFTTKEQGRGTGLGLAMVYGIVRHHGGDIQIESEIGRRTLVRVYLPHQDTTDVQVEKEAQVLGHHGQPRILMIDDDALQLRSTKRLLEQLGYPTYAAGTGEEGISIFRAASSEISVVLLDLMLDGMPSETVLREIQRIRSDVTVLVITGYAAEKRVAALLAEGVRGVLRKPFAPNVLDEALQKAVSGRGMETIDTGDF